MATWTNMKMEGLVEFEWANSLKTFVRCKTIYGNMPDMTIKELEEKVRDRLALPVIHNIYKDMLEWARANL